MTDKLSLYKGAARVLGDRKIQSLSENRVTRRELDGAWDDGAVRTCLSLGLWNFAMRTVQIDYSPSVEPDFGYQRAFDKPTDWVRTAIVAEDEYFNQPLTRYADEAEYWYSDLDVIYAKFVSDGNSYGADFSKWPQNFVRVVEHYLALQICDRVTQSQTKKEDVEKDMRIWLNRAKTTDAMDEHTTFPPRGSWANSRMGGRSRERAGRGNLMG